MKKLSELYNINSDVEIKDIKINSKEVEPGDLFVCTKGVTADRHDFIPDAIKNGASALVVSKDVDASIPTVKVEDTNKELPLLCSRFYNHPEDKLYMIGVTGTDGKTSVTTIVQTLLGNDICAYMGTNGRSCAKFNKDTGNTTPDSDKLYKYFDEFVKAGCKYMAMETSSEAFFRGRLTNLRYKIGAITNITREHLNIHGSFENYIDCKCQLFRQIDSDGYAILNKDDEYIKKYKVSSKAKIYYISLNEKADAYAKNIKITAEGTSFDLYIKGEKINVKTSLLGQKNIYNILSSSLMAYLLGLSLKEIKKGISNIKPISHRLEIKKVNNLTIIDDSYNSNPIGAKNALEVLSLMEGEKIIITPGMVEMGKEENNLNYNFGKDMANICDKFYLIGKKRSNPIVKGILETNKNADIKVFNKFDDAYNDVIKGVKRKNVTLLIENDLPDLYLEK